MPSPLTDIIKLLTYGGSVRVSAKRFDATDLIQMADNVPDGSRLEIADAGDMDGDNMATIAARGQGRVLFDLT